MLDRNQRILVEAVRNSKVIEISIPGLQLKSPDKKLIHDIAICLQSHFNTQNNEENRKARTRNENKYMDPRKESSGNLRKVPTGY